MIGYPHTVYHHRWTAGTDDGYNEAVDVYTPPLNQTGRAVPAFWATPYTTEPRLAGHDRGVVDVELFIPNTETIGAHDLFDVNGKQYEVIGEAEDFNHGPFGGGWPLRINLRRVEG